MTKPVPMRVILTSVVSELLKTGVGTTDFTDKEG